MGNMGALGMASAVDAGDVDIRAALEWHLGSNHYPPLPSTLVDTALEVLEAVEAGEYDRDVDLPAGVSWRGLSSAPVLACLEAWHLEAFLPAGEDEGWDA